MPFILNRLISIRIGTAQRNMKSKPFSKQEYKEVINQGIKFIHKRNKKRDFNLSIRSGFLTS